MTTMNSLHKEVVAATQYVRDRLGQANIGRFRFEIETSGLTSSEAHNVKIKYVVCGDYSDTVTGDSLVAVVSEVMRRKGWDDKHSPLALTDETGFGK